MTEQAIESTSLSDVQVRDLEGLLETFGSQFSLEDIASTYSQAEHDLNVASDILVSMNGPIVNRAMDASKGKLEGVYTTPLHQASDNVLLNCYPGRKNITVLKSKNHPLSMGSVSGAIGKEYMKTKTLTNNFSQPTKPMKLDSKELPISETWCDEVLTNVPEKIGSMAADVEKFLFKMLGDGFQLDMRVIEEVLGCCGHAMQKSMEKLTELSASTLEKCDDIVNIAAEKCFQSSSVGSLQRTVQARNFFFNKNK